MSAILARINFDGAPIVRDVFCRAFEVMAPYGGDGSDTWIEGPVGLGQHLLRFTPESSYEKQPHQWNDAVIVADARIDNRDELCGRFDLSQPEAAVTPDSHLILRAYRLWGEDCAAHLLGDFAFAIWDRRNQSLFCARDHIGARPLYYYHTPSATAVATDIRSLLELPDVKCTIDELEVATYLIWPLVTSNNTLFEEIHILRPGWQMSISPTGLTLQAHWSANNASAVRYKTVDEYAEHFRSLLEAAVAARVHTNYPVGAHLSSGLDSSGVTVLANRQLRQKGRSLDMTYSWSPEKSDVYPPVRYDERNVIELLCQQEGIPCHYGTSTGQSYRDFLARDMAAEVITDLWEELQVLIHASERGIRSILSGWGGDEAATYSGRGYVAYLLKRGRFLDLARMIRRIGGVRRPFKALQFLFRQGLIPLLPDILYDHVDPLYRSDRQCLYVHPVFAARFPQTPKLRQTPWREVADPQKMQVQLLQKGHLAARMATWAIWSSPYQLSYTYPLTDRRVLEFAVGLPPELSYQHGVSRYLFRAALKDILPPLSSKGDVVNQRKRLDCALICWNILADEVRNKQLLQNDIPWLDVEKLRAKVLAVPGELTPEQLLEFIPLTTAIRVWHLWQRYGERTEA